MCVSPDPKKIPLLPFSDDKKIRAMIPSGDKKYCFC
jgi:hypothetical protein